MIIIDFIIIAFLIFGFVIGVSRGAIKEIIILFGSLLILFISYKFKSVLAWYLYNNLPLNFGVLSKLKTLNYFIYEIIAFIILFLVLFVIYRLILSLANVVDKLIKATIILNLPSKIIGGALGFVQTYIVLFLIITVVSFPGFNLYKYVNNSALAPIILYKSPILSNYLKPITKSLDDINDIDLKNKTNIDEKIFIILMKNGIINKKIANKLNKESKIDIKNADELIERWAK